MQATSAWLFRYEVCSTARPAKGGQVDAGFELFAVNAAGFEQGAQRGPDLRAPPPKSA